VKKRSALVDDGALLSQYFSRQILLFQQTKPPFFLEAQLRHKLSTPLFNFEPSTFLPTQLKVT